MSDKAPDAKQWCIEEWHVATRSWVIIAADLTENEAKSRVKANNSRSITDIRYLRVRKLDGPAHNH